MNEDINKQMEPPFTSQPMVQLHPGSLACTDSSAK